MKYVHQQIQNELSLAQGSKGTINNVRNEDAPSEQTGEMTDEVAGETEKLASDENWSARTGLTTGDLSELFVDDKNNRRQFICDLG